MPSLPLPPLPVPGAAGAAGVPDATEGARPVEVLHEGRWVPATLLHAYRVGERWRAVVRYYTGAGSQFQQARWAEDVRRPAVDA
ncbi:hypothetical protein [Motilibacter deserti]|uniref:Uncharacterized protein n=1 Tax=Motilibacter deserti TaxID=2714956 RepID=A0ABX0GNV8_9ACTN|nr:hypothetical protein [Motilibacter deserti]NHC12514.1 hypothetical protein [Motilibacter deserti]